MIDLRSSVPLSMTLVLIVDKSIENQSVHLDVKPMCRRTSKRNQVCGGLDKFEVVLGEPALNEGTLAGMHKVPKLRG
jgi:hypothetical protein